MSEGSEFLERLSVYYNRSRNRGGKQLKLLPESMPEDLHIIKQGNFFIVALVWNDGTIRVGVSKKSSEDEANKIAGIHMAARRALRNKPVQIFKLNAQLLPLSQYSHGAFPVYG